MLFSLVEATEYVNEFERWRFWASASSLQFSDKPQACIFWQSEPSYL